MTTSASVTTKIRLCDGKKDTWEDDSHDFITYARAKFPKASYDGFDIRQYLNRADPVLWKAKKEVMANAVLGTFRKDHPDHVEAADDVAYEVLNTMFKPASPAYVFIRSKAAAGTIPIGKGWDLYEALIKWATRGKTATRSSSQKVKELTKLALQNNEDIDTYVERFEKLLLQLAAQDPPQVFPEALRMQWLVNGLPAKFEKVIDKFDREEYADSDALLDAIVTEADILASKEDQGSASMGDIAAAADGEGKLSKGQKYRRRKAARKAAAAAANGTAGDGSGLAAGGNGNTNTEQATSDANGKGKGGKGKSSASPTHAGRQCFRCWGYGHIARDGPPVAADNGNAAAAWGIDTRHWCPFHNSYQRHTP